MRKDKRNVPESVRLLDEGSVNRLHSVLEPVLARVMEEGLVQRLDSV